MTVLSHSIELMDEWSSKMGDNSNYYDTLVGNLYNLIYQLAGSEDFRGGLADDFLEQMEIAKPKFNEYSDTFQECIDIVKEKAMQIQDDEQYLLGKINSGNSLG